MGKVVGNLCLKSMPDHLLVMIFDLMEFLLKKSTFSSLSSLILVQASKSFDMVLEVIMKR